MFECVNRSFIRKKALSNLDSNLLLKFKCISIGVTIRTHLFQFLIFLDISYNDRFTLVFCALADYWSLKLKIRITTKTGMQICFTIFKLCRLFGLHFKTEPSLWISFRVSGYFLVIIWEKSECDSISASTIIFFQLRSYKNK